jgi:hypothetical protein
MPEKATIDKAKAGLEGRKSPTTAAGEIEHVRQGKHGARSPQQAIAIRLSEASKSRNRGIFFLIGTPSRYAVWG